MRQGKIQIWPWRCNSSPGCDEGLGWFLGVCFVFLLVKLLLKRETIFILTSFHIPVPNNTHSDRISIFFFFLPGSTWQSLSCSCLYSCLFNPWVPFFIHCCQTPWTGSWRLPKRPQALNTSTGWPSGKLLHLIKENYLQPLEKDQSHSHQLKRSTDYLQTHSITHLLEKISAGTSKAQKAPNFIWSFVNSVNIWNPLCADEHPQDTDKALCIWPQSALSFSDPKSSPGIQKRLPSSSPAQYKLSLIPFPPERKAVSQPGQWHLHC